MRLHDPILRRRNQCHVCSLPLQMRHVQQRNCVSNLFFFRVPLHEHRRSVLVCGRLLRRLRNGGLCSLQLHLRNLYYLHGMCHLRERQPPHLKRFSVLLRPVLLQCANDENLCRLLILLQHVLCSCHLQHLQQHTLPCAQYNHQQVRLPTHLLRRPTLQRALLEVPLQLPRLLKFDGMYFLRCSQPPRNNVCEHSLQLYARLLRRRQYYGLPELHCWVPDLHQQHAVHQLQRLRLQSCQPHQQTVRV